MLGRVCVKSSVKRLRVRASRKKEKGFDQSRFAPYFRSVLKYTLWRVILSVEGRGGHTTLARCNMITTILLFFVS